MKIMDIVMWLIFGAIFLAVLRNPKGFTAAGTTLFGGTDQILGTLSAKGTPGG